MKKDEKATEETQHVMVSPSFSHIKDKNKSGSVTDFSQFDQNVQEASINLSSQTQKTKIDIPSENLKQLDEQLEKLQLQIIKNQYKNTFGADEETEENEEQKAPSVKDFLFSFRNEGESQIPSSRNIISPQSSNMRFLNEVNIHTGSQSEQVLESSRVADQSKESSFRQSKSQNTTDRLNDEEEEVEMEEVQEEPEESSLEVIAEDIHELQGSDTYGSQQLQMAQKSRNYSIEESKQLNLDSQRGSYPRNAPIIIDSYNSEEDRPLKQNVTSTTEQDDQYTIQVDFKEISQTWANQINNTTRSNVASENLESHRYSAKQYPEMHVNKLVQQQAPISTTTKTVAGDISPKSTSGVSCSSDYVKIFEQLLNKALNNQNQFLVFLDVQGDQLQIPDVSSILIEPYSTKSFKDLCFKMIEQVCFMSEVYMNQAGNAIDLEKQVEYLNQQLEESQMQIQELYESQAQEAQLQEQIQNARMEEIQRKYNAQIESVQTLQKSQLTNYQQLIETQKKKIFKLNEDMRKIKENGQSSQHDLNQERLNTLQNDNENLSKMNELLQQKIKIIQTELNNQVQKQPEIVRALQSKISRLEQERQVLKQTQQNEDDLKGQVSSQIKENIQIEVKYKHIINQRENEILRLESQINELQDTIEANTKQYLEEKHAQQIKHECQLEEHSEATMEVKHQLDKLKQNYAKTVHELQIKKEELLHTSQQLKTLQYKQEQKQNIDSSNRETIAVLQEKCNSMARKLEDYDWIYEQLEDVTVSFALQKENGKYYMPMETNSNKYMQMTSRTHRSSTHRSQNRESIGNPMVADLAQHYALQFQGVPSYAQAVAQSKLIDRFLKLDKSQKTEIKELKKKINEIEEIALNNTQDVLKIQEEKAALEQLILEILSFGEQCDKQFDALQESYKKFEVNDKSESDKQIQMLQKIKKSLTDSVKTIIVDIEDHDLRDMLLNILTRLGNKQVEVNEAITQIMDNLVMRVRDLLQVSKEQRAKITLLQATDEQLRESEIQRDLVQNQLKDANSKILNQNDQFHRICVQIGDILEVAKEHENMLKTQGQTKLMVDICSEQIEKPVKNREEILEMEDVVQAIEKEIRLIYDWVTEQKRDLPTIINERKKIVELNLKINQLVHENSVLSILTEKQKLINEKYKQNVKNPMFQNTASVRHLTHQTSQEGQQHTRFSSCGSNYRKIDTKFDSLNGSQRFTPRNYYETSTGEFREHIQDQSLKKPKVHENASKKKEKPTKQSKHERLHNILNRVQDLKGELQLQQEPIQHDEIPYYDQKGSFDLSRPQKRREKHHHSQDSNVLQPRESVHEIEPARGIRLQEQEANNKFFEAQLNSFDQRNLEEYRNLVSQQYQEVPDHHLFYQYPEQLQRSFQPHERDPMNNTVQDGHLESYRRSEGELQQTSQFTVNPLASTNKVTTKKSSLKKVKSKSRPRAVGSANATSSLIIIPNSSRKKRRSESMNSSIPSCRLRSLTKSRNHSSLKSKRSSTKNQNSTRNRSKMSRTIDTDIIDLPLQTSGNTLNNSKVIRNKAESNVQSGRHHKRQSSIETLQYNPYLQHSKSWVPSPKKSEENAVYMNQNVLTLGEFQSNFGRQSQEKLQQQKQKQKEDLANKHFQSALQSQQNSYQTSKRVENDDCYKNGVPFNTNQNSMFQSRQESLEKLQPEQPHILNLIPCKHEALLVQKPSKSPTKAGTKKLAKSKSMTVSSRPSRNVKSTTVQNSSKASSSLQQSTIDREQQHLRQEKLNKINQLLLQQNELLEKQMQIQSHYQHENQQQFYVDENSYNQNLQTDWQNQNHSRPISQYNQSYPTTQRSTTRIYQYAQEHQNRNQHVSLHPQSVALSGNTSFRTPVAENQDLPVYMSELQKAPTDMFSMPLRERHLMFNQSSNESIGLANYTPIRYPDVKSQLIDKPMKSQMPAGLNNNMSKQRHQR